jgi:hypothetical protein
MIAETEFLIQTLSNVRKKRFRNYALFLKICFYEKPSVSKPLMVYLRNSNFLKSFLQMKIRWINIVEN